MPRQTISCWWQHPHKEDEQKRTHISHRSKAEEGSSRNKIQMHKNTGDLNVTWEEIKADVDQARQKGVK